MAAHQWRRQQRRARRLAPAAGRAVRSMTRRRRGFDRPGDATWARVRHDQSGLVSRATRKSACGWSPTGLAVTTTAKSPVAWSATRWPISRLTATFEEMIDGAPGTDTRSERATRSRGDAHAERRGQRQHGRGAAGAAIAMRDDLGRATAASIGYETVSSNS